MTALSYSHGACSVPLLGETIGENLRRTVERYGDREALVVRHQGYRTTYRELWEQTSLAARGLLARGVEKGDRVGIWAPNRYEWFVVQYATARIGAILVNVNPAYKTAELQYALSQAGVSILILSRGFRQSDYVGMLGAVWDRCPELREAIVFESDWQALLASGSRIPEADLDEREAALQFDDPVNIQYTSGTTGFPKGATLSHHGLINNGFFLGETMRYTERDRVLNLFPFYHCGGMVVGNLAATTHGACVVVPSESYEPLTAMTAVAEERCTSVLGVPTMFIGMLDHPAFDQFDFSSLRTGLMGGSPCPIEVMKKVQTKMHATEMTIGCGMTETSPASTQTAVDDSIEKRVTTVGRAHPHVEIKIVDPVTGAIAPRGVPGEQCTRGYSVMLGYWNNEEATADAIDAARWMHTGDLALMRDDGYVKIVGRIKDMIIRGGENISPREIEEFLYTHPRIADVQVIG
ncbi:MAG: AMP-binding protein, partial [Chloroflexi bacterium]|nr:AMP-binding protein [Chloroflexota bacterium]